VPEIAVYLPLEMLVTIDELRRREDRTRSAQIRWLLRLGLERLEAAGLDPPEYRDEDH
jgi:metal-responsive CopG/Arc/MetJ family transcriptional regulator